MPWTSASTAAGWPRVGAVALALSFLVSPGVARAQPPSAPDASALDSLIAEAAARFAIPERWIRSVMGVESAFRVRAISPAGAMGLMQLMPRTYAELRVRYGLGADPFRPRDNILAGAAYLREMYDRYGSAGFLAAYNAGPARYEQHLLFGRSLPTETRAYVATLTPQVGGAAAETARPTSEPPSLFVSLGSDPWAGELQDGRPPGGNGRAGQGLFVALSASTEAR